MPQIVSSEGAYGSATKPTINLSTPPALVVAQSDGEGNILGTSTTPILARVQDGASTNTLTVSAFHSGDNQQPGGLAYGLLTGGVAQLLNASGNLDRQRATGVDVIGNAGVATGTQQMAWPATCGPVTSGAITASATTTIAAASNNQALPQATINAASTTGFPASGTIAVASNAGIQLVAYTGTTGTTFTGCTGGTGLMSTGSSLSQVQTLTLTAVSGTVRGVAWAIAVGQSLVLDANLSTQDAMVILGLNVGAKTVQVVPVKTHGASATATAFFYDQARSAMVPDGSSGQGLSAGATYLLNTTLNSGASGWEGERSAAGELDGASGAGTAVAAEYEFNSGGPVLASGVASLLNFDRARNLNGKGAGTNTITSSTAGNTSIVFGSAAQTNTIAPGCMILLSGSGTAETVYASTTWTPGSSATVPVQSPVVNTGQTTARWDNYAAQGPQLTGFTAYGLGIEEEALYDPVSALYYIERSATQDNAVAPNIVLESEALYTHFSGNGFERARSVTGKNLVSGTLTAGTVTALGSTGVTTLTFTADPSLGFTPLKAGSAILLGPIPASAEVVYVTSGYTSGVAVPITATQVTHTSSTAQWEAFGWNGPGLSGFLSTGMDVDEDAVYDPVSGLYYLERSATADGMAGTNIVAEHTALYNGATFDRWRSAATGVALVAKGTTTAQTSLSAVTANGTGTAIDLGSAYSNMSAVVTTTGSPTGGTVTVMVSLDNTTFVSSSATATVGASPSNANLSNVAYRYVRLDLSGLAGGTTPTVTAKVMAS